MIARTDLRSESLRLAVDPTAPLNARLFVSHWLQRWNLGHVAEAARAGVTELAAWVVAHPAGALLRITVSYDDPLLFTEVADGGEDLPWRPAWLLDGETIRDEEGCEVGGLAVRLLEGAEEEWGADPMPGGRCLWASYRTVVAGPGAEAV